MQKFAVLQQILIPIEEAKAVGTMSHHLSDWQIQRADWHQKSASIG